MDAKTDASSRAGVLSGDVPKVVGSLEQNANKAKRMGMLCLGMSLIVGVAILLFFVVASQEAAQQRAAQERETIRFRVETAQAAFEQIIAAGTAVGAATQATPRTPDGGSQRRVEDLLSSIARPAEHDTFGDILYSITSSILRIGAVLIGIFLIQILVSFSRYYFKLAEHLSMSGALIGLTGGKISDLKTAAPLLLPSSIDFGKTPTSPVEKVLEGAFGTIRELSKKIPSK